MRPLDKTLTWQQRQALIEKSAGRIALRKGQLLRDIMHDMSQYEAELLKEDN